MFDGVDENTVDDRRERTLGAFYYGLTVGLAVQWLFDPEGAPINYYCPEQRGVLDQAAAAAPRSDVEPN
jgi:hypothetical protein